MVNDICGFADPEMPCVCREHDAAVSKMASPPDLERPGAIEDVDEIYEALSMNGLTDKTILDPAFGGWSKAKPTPTTARRSTGYGFRGYGRPLLVSRSTARASSRRSRDGVPRRFFRCRSPPPRWQREHRDPHPRCGRDAGRGNTVGAEFARDRVRSDDGPSDIAVEELDVTTVREAERHLDRLDADQSVAGDAAVRTYELRGLTDEAVGALRAATAEPGVGAAFALAGSDAAETAVPPRPPTAGPPQMANPDCSSEQ